MAITTMNAWTTGTSATEGNEKSDGSTVFSTKNAQDLETLLAAIIATLDEMKGQL